MDTDSYRTTRAATTSPPRISPRSGRSTWTRTATRPIRSPHLSGPRPEGLPPAYVVTAGCDPLRDEGRAYVTTLRDAGVPAVGADFPEMFHGFLALNGELEAARRALRGVAEAIASISGSDSKICGDHGGAAG
ncbi:alpha/beta hydrolase fold domain-containing protein [Streptomyces sp. NPDC001970]